MPYIKKISLKGFKRFHDLTLDLGNNPKKIIALVGPNGCGKSSVFDAFEHRLKDFKIARKQVSPTYFEKQSPDIQKPFNKNENIKIDFTDEGYQINQTTFCIRSAYRHTSTLDIQSIEQQKDIREDYYRPTSTADTDSRLIDNYQRLISGCFTDFMEGEKTVKQTLQEKFGKINDVLSRTLEIEIRDPGNIHKPGRGKLFFKKGKSIDFPFDNLSAGEKEVIDLIMDLMVRSKDYTDTIFCIDEPELHLNTKIQRQLLVELEELIPDTCQLWIATHSVGFLRALQEELKDRSQILDFSEKDFDQEVVIESMRPSRANWKRIFSTALEDIAELVAPRQIIYCEGKKVDSQRGKEAGMDAKVYNEIFGEEYTDTVFVSAGGNTEPEKNMIIGIMVLSKVLNKVEFLRLSDCDDKSENERDEWLKEETSRRMLVRREIENYLFDKEILQQAFPDMDNFAYDKIVSDICIDDVKSKIPELLGIVKKKGKITNDEACLMLAKLVTPSTQIYKDLKACIWHI